MRCGGISRKSTLCLYRLVILCFLDFGVWCDVTEYSRICTSELASIPRERGCVGRSPLVDVCMYSLCVMGRRHGGAWRLYHTAISILLVSSIAPPGTHGFRHLAPRAPPSPLHLHTGGGARHTSTTRQLATSPPAPLCSDGALPELEPYEVCV